MPGPRVDMNTSALYGNNQFGFDKHNSWENYYTQNRPLPMPVVDWRNPQPQQCANMYNIPKGPQYPTNQNATSCSWTDISKTNWSDAL
jgi:hypothetical protein